MLILTRTPSQTVHIGDDIVLTILAVRGEQVKLGFKASKGIAIHRAEIFSKIMAESQTEPFLSNPSTQRAVDDSRSRLGKGEAVLSFQSLQGARDSRRKHGQASTKTDLSNRSSNILSNTGEHSCELTKVP